jgi:uncharacterized glyoxalase superfamily protein PhnB
MQTFDMNPAVIPCLRYRDAPAAIDWLSRVFGFESHLVVPGEAGAIMHAELRIDTGAGGGMIMIGSAGRGGAYGDLMTQPEDIAGRQTQTIYLAVADADVVHARARAAGARMVIDLADEAHGGRGFTCRDPEGHVWSIGTYTPARI